MIWELAELIRMLISMHFLSAALQVSGDITMTNMALTDNNALRPEPSGLKPLRSRKALIELMFCPTTLLLGAQRCNAYA